MRLPAPQSFSFEAAGIQNVLITPAFVRPAFDPHTTAAVDVPPGLNVNAIWDTGATGSVVTSKVIARCNLKQTGMRKVRGVHGEANSPVFLVNIEIPPNTGFHAIEVTQGELGDVVDLLIGMDIINKGDFAVTNKDGKTVFSFRCPSAERIDFAKGAMPSAGRNEPCPCGSGKKYKRCHGRAK